VRILVKIGGAQLEEPQQRAQLCKALAKAKAEGHELVVVHGGGNQIRQLTRALQLPEAYVDGLRVTDGKTAEVVLMVLGGSVNRTLVHALQQAGVPAVGISGADGGTFTAKKLEHPKGDLGFVGVVDHVNPQLVQSLLHSGYVPVIATTSPGSAPGSAPGSEPFFNLNADHAAGPLCRAFGCDALLFLTDVPAVLDAQKQRLPVLTPADCQNLVQSGVASGGMLPKLDAALMALRDNPRALIKIAPGSAHDAVLSALRSSVGTTFTTDGAATETHHG
jgi:acetylglutamate kinase